MNLGQVNLRERRRRGTPVVHLNLTVAPDSQAKLDVIADALGKSEGIIIDLIMESLPVDYEGRPAFWSGPLAPKRTGSEVGTFHRNRRHGTKVVQLNLAVAPEAKAKLDAIAVTLGKSRGIIFDLIMESLDVDHEGRPAFWDGPLVTDPPQGDLFGPRLNQLEAS